MYVQQQEEYDFSNSYYDRFAGFDRGDSGSSYEEEQAARNEQDEAEYQASLNH